jgi:4-amino-4-deoxy-L-arabinose transferase-like glycosyltransferase
LKKWTWAALPLLWLLMALSLRDITRNAIWLDETWSISNAGGAQYGPLSPLEIVQRVSADDPRNAAPLYHLTLAGWGGLVGWSAFAARYSSLLFGLLAAAWTYRLARDLGSPLAGVGALTVLVTSPLFVYFSHELRTYMLATLFVPMALALYWRLIHTARPSAWLQVGFVVSLLGLLYTHYLAAAAIPAILVYHLLFVRKTRSWWRPVLLIGAAGLLFLPWLGTLASAMSLNQAQAADRGALPLSGVVERLITQFGGGAPVLVGIALLLALLALRRSGGRAAWVFALVIVGITIAANAAFQLLVPGRERYLLMAWPALAALVGVGIGVPSSEFRVPSLKFSVLSPRPSVLTLVSCLLLATLLLTGADAALRGDLTRDIDGTWALPWDALADTLRTEAVPGDALAAHITFYNWALEVRTADYHLHGLPVKWTLLEQLPHDTFQEAALQFVGDAPDVWVALDKRLPPRDALADFTSTLSGHYAYCGIVFDLPRLRLDLYKRLPESAFDPSQALMRFGDGIALTYARVSDRRVTLAWARAADVPPNTYSVSLQVMDAAGNLVTQTDYGLPEDALACRQTDFPPDKLPAGDYRLRVVVYNWQTGERLPGVAASTGERGDTLPLGALKVP